MESLADFVANLHFLRPWWLLALPVLVFLVYRLWRRGLAERSWREVCDAELLPFILQQRPQGRARWGLILLAFCGLSLIVALAGPAWQRLPVPVERLASALVIVVDLSRSMDAGDIRPSRVERVRYKLADLLRLRREGQTALVVYAADAFTVVPLSDDARTIVAQLPALGTDLLPTQGKAPARGLALAADLLAQAGVQQGHVLLVSDDATSAARRAARSLLAAGHRLSVLAVGTRVGAPIALPGGGFLKDERGAIVFPKANHDALRSLARTGGGQYVALARDDSDIQSLQAFFSRARDSEAGPDGLQTDIWQDQGHWLVLLVLPFAALGFRRGLVWALCPLLLLPLPAPAADWWLNRNQQAMQHFQEEDYEAAAGQFADERWQAAAHYRSGHYEQSLQSLDPVTAEDWYNHGNALARLGRYPDALEAYEQSLALAPGAADTIHNRDVVAEALRQQQQQAGEQEAGEDGEGQSGEGQSQSAGEQGDTGEQQGSEGAEQAGAEQSGAEQTGQGEGSEEGREQQAAGSGEEQDSQQAMDQSGQPADDGEAGRNRVMEDSDDDSMADRLLLEQRQATEQWLRRIPDDTAALLRRKFRYQEQERR